MRYVRVMHPMVPDFIVGIPDCVEDTDAFLGTILPSITGWTEAEDSPSALMEREWP